MEFVGVWFNEAQVLRLELFDVGVFKFETEILDDAVVVVAVADVQHKSVVIIYGVDDFEHVNHIDSNDDFAFFAIKYFEVVSSKIKVNQDGVRFVHIHNADTVGLKDDVGFQEDVFEGRHQDAEGCYLHGFNGEDIIIVFFITVHWLLFSYFL